LTTALGATASLRTRPLLGHDEQMTIPPADPSPAAVGGSLSSDSAVPAVWEQRFRAPSVGMPQWGRLAPQRCIVSSNQGGTTEVYAWSPGGRLRQVTDRRNGTSLAGISPDGTDIWWFDDTDGDEFGTWRVEPWDGSSPARPAHPALQPGYSAGLALAEDGTCLVGRSDDDGCEIWRLDPADAGGERAEPVLVYRSEQDAEVADVTHDGELWCLEHAEHGDNRHAALRLLARDGTLVADLWDGPGLGLDALGFAPGDARMLVAHERRGRQELLVWDGARPGGGVNELAVDATGEHDADWYPSGDALLVSAINGARSTLYRHDLTAGRTEPLPSPVGTIEGAAVRPDGDVWLAHSSGEHPPSVRDAAGAVVLAPDGPPAPLGVAVEDIAVEASWGAIHALVSTPIGEGPHPAVCYVHGGPAAHDEDAYEPRAAALVDAGYACIQVNYRGSTGYGSTWRDALEASVGLTELEDIAAVRGALVERGVIDPARVALLGASWGGYLTLLGLGVQPELWAVGVAVVPVADYVAAYDDEMEPLKAFDRALFGGTPEERPEAYRQASPITYVDRVQAPVLVMAGENDSRCPIRQIENYLARLAELGRGHEVYRFDAGHGSLVVEERLQHMRVQLAYLARHLPVASSLVAVEHASPAEALSR